MYLSFTQIDFSCILAIVYLIRGISVSRVVIRAEHIAKKYKLGVLNNGTLFRDIQSLWARLRGKDDPHVKLDADNSNILTKQDFWALKDISFDIYEGDRVAFIGKNGAGKSTLLKILSRITTPTEGVVKIRGKVSSLLEVGTGFHYELTGRENIYLNGAVLGMKKKEIDARMDAIIDFSGISQHIDTPIKRYSSGMQVRLGFAVASHLACDILIADEVLAVGDIEFQKKAISKMNSLSESEGRTVLFVSHNLVAVRNLCTKGFVLDKGRLISEADNINESISEYMEMSSETSSSICLNKAEVDNSIELTSILINGESKRNVEYVAGDKLTIEIRGKTKVRQPVCLELIIKNELDVPLAYYNRFGHCAPAKAMEIGEFCLKEEIAIPNIITGRYFVKLTIVNPNVRFLVKFDNAFVLNAQGIKALNGVSFSYSDVGFIKIEG